MDNDAERAAENIRKLARAIGLSEKEASEAAARFHEIAHRYWGNNIMFKFPKLNLNVCAGCGNRCLFDLQSVKDHPCPLYNRTLRCKFRHFLVRFVK